MWEVELVFRCLFITKLGQVIRGAGQPRRVRAQQVQAPFLQVILKYEVGEKGGGEFLDAHFVGKHSKREETMTVNHIGQTYNFDWIVQIIFAQIFTNNFNLQKRNLLSKQNRYFW